MKRFYSISRNRNTSPLFLMFSLAIALYIMFFINGFMGSLGGIPAATASFCVIYMLRGMVNDGNCISHQLALSSRNEVAYLFLNYSLGYGVTWAVMRVLQVIARITGWGTIEGMSVYTYFRNLYGTSMLERWAYIFTAVLMFSFAISLFPIVVIHKKRIVVLYLLLDSLVYLLITFGIRFICKFHIRKVLQNRAKCVLDALLLSQFPKTWQSVAFMIGVFLLLILSGIVALVVANRFHGPKPGKIKVPENRFPVVEGDEEDFKQALLAINRKRNINRIISLVALAAFVFAGALYLFTPHTSKEGYTKVAEFLTDDSGLGPMLYGSDIYIPVNEVLEYHEEGMALGYIGHKGENCDSRFYKLAVSNILYKKAGDTRLQMYGSDNANFQLAQILALEENWKKDSVFFLWDEEWESESASHKGNSGYAVLTKELVEKLNNAFPDKSLNVEDFKEFDAFFTIMGYENASKPLNENVILSDWCGYILVKENQFFFNNYDNLIEGALMEELKAVVGGNTNGGNPTTEIQETEQSSQ